MSRANIEFFHHPEAGNFEARLDQHREAHMELYGYDVTGIDYHAEHEAG